MAEQEERRLSGEREKEGAPKPKNEGTNSGPQSKIINYIKKLYFNGIISLSV